MTEFFEINGYEINGTDITADTLWDEVNFNSNDDITVFIDVTTSCNLSLHTKDPDSTSHEVNSFSVDASGDSLILTGSYQNIQLSIDTTATTTAWYESAD